MRTLFSSWKFCESALCCLHWTVWSLENQLVEDILEFPQRKFGESVRRVRVTFSQLVEIHRVKPSAYNILVPLVVARDFSSIQPDVSRFPNVPGFNDEICSKFERCSMITTKMASRVAVNWSVVQMVRTLIANIDVSNDPFRELVRNSCLGRTNGSGKFPVRKVKSLDCFREQSFPMNSMISLTRYRRLIAFGLRLIMFGLKKDSRNRDWGAVGKTEWNRNLKLA